MGVDDLGVEPQIADLVTRPRAEDDGDQQGDGDEQTHRRDNLGRGRRRRDVPEQEAVESETDRR